MTLSRLAITAFIAGATLYGSPCHADPIPLTRAQYQAVERINRDINAHMPIRRADGVGNCVAVAERKYQALISAGYPSYAVHTVTVRSPGWGSPLHRLVMVETTNGPVYLDMNSPWLVTDIAKMGYRPYAWTDAFTPPAGTTLGYPAPR